MNNPFIINAIAHVREFHPEVTMVVFNKYGQWQYMDDNFDSPIFGENINQSILEEASDSVEELPFVYQI